MCGSSIVSWYIGQGFSSQVAASDIGGDITCKVHVATENVHFVPLALRLHIALLCWTRPARVAHAPT